jgi:acetyl-CoA C-acetyltransferase
VSQTVTILGAAALRVGKWQAAPDAPTQKLEHEVLADLVIEAMQDAGLDRREIGSLTFSLPRPYTQQKYFGTFMANYLRLPCAGSVSEIMGNGMTAGLAFEGASNDIRLGRSRVALALGVNFETAISATEHMMSSMRTTGDVDFHTPFGFTPISWYAMDAARYIHEFKSSREELASVAVKNRFHASLNPIAQFRKLISLEDVLAQPLIVEPLGLYEVPPRSDGAVCLVLADEDVARAVGRPYVRIKGRGFFHEGAHQINEVPNDMIALVAAQTASTPPARLSRCSSVRPWVSRQGEEAPGWLAMERRLWAAEFLSARRAAFNRAATPLTSRPSTALLRSWISCGTAPTSGRLRMRASH